ncbi:MAG: adenylate/guanylate cyclase domain-containing protein [Acidimicrobiia bacterium]
METPETRYAVTRDGTHIAYRSIGTGPRELVFIPPWTSCVELDVDDPYIGETIRRGASIGRFVSFDKRGTGMSDPVERDVCPTLEERADELTAVLEAAGCVRPTVFTGADGAAVALVFAAMYPDRLNALCLYAPFARFVDAPDYPIGYPREVAEFMVEQAGRTWGSGQFAPTAPSMADDRRFLEWFGAYQRRSASPSTATRFLRMAFETDVRDVLPLVRVPTVVMHRSDDTLVPVAAGRYVADRIPGARFVELEGSDHFWAIGDSDAVLDEMEEAATGVRPVAKSDRVLATVLFTDIVGSTDQLAAVGDTAWRELLEAHDQTARMMIARHHGDFIHHTGDGFLATFDGPARAVRCAHELDKALERIGLDIRAGVHTGEIERRGDHVAGLAVHVGARVAALAEAHQVLATRTVKDLTAGSGLRFTDYGEHALKGVPDTWHLFAVTPS